MATFKCNFSSGPGRWGRWFTQLLMIAALAGCAATVPARVTTFQRWPADAVGATWKFDTNEQQRDSLEYGDYADQVRSALGPVGLVEARAGQAARFVVAMSYGVEPVKVAVERPGYDPYYGSWGPYGYGGWGAWGGRGHGGFAFMAPFPSTYPSTVVIDASRSFLKIEIRDSAHNNAKVYESTAVNVGAGDSLPQVMPYLVRAIFDGFPDTNGQVREVNYDVEKR